jgi:hypothetical protein
MSAHLVRSLALTLGLALLTTALPASAQEAGTAQPTALRLSLDAGSADAAGLHAQRRTGIALMTMGIASHLVGAGAATYGLLVLGTQNACINVCPAPQSQDVPLGIFATGLVTAGLGLVSFVVGLVADVDARVRLGRRGPGRAVSLDAAGLSVSF